MEKENLSPQEFIESYGLSAPVRVGRGEGREVTLGQALKAENAFCPADKEKREDPVERVGYLAKILAAAGTLRPEDEHFLSRPE